MGKTPKRTVFMSDELAVVIGKVAELNGRASEINRRIQQDAQVRIAAGAVGRIERPGALWKIVPAPPPPPTSPRVLRIVEAFEADWTLALNAALSRILHSSILLCSKDA